MPWTVYIHREARNVLKHLARPVRQRIADKIQRLANDPDDPSLDIKALSGRSGFRLRIGGWRVLYTRDEVIRVIAIEQIRPRGDAYK